MPMTVVKIMGVVFALILATVNISMAQPSCRDWNTIDFFAAATSEDIVRCVATGFGFGSAY